MTRQHGRNGSQDTLVLGWFAKIVATLLVLGIAGQIVSERLTAVEFSEVRGEIRLVAQQLKEATKQAAKRDEILTKLADRVSEHDLQIDRLERPGG